MRTRENFFLACNRTRIILLRVKKPQILEYVLEYFQNFKLKSINVYCKKTKFPIEALFMERFCFVL